MIRMALGEKSVIYKLSWSPKVNKFAVLYLFLYPLKLLLSNNCDLMFEFRREHCNNIHYNPHTNILLLGGFIIFSEKALLCNMTREEFVVQDNTTGSTLLHWLALYDRYHCSRITNG